MPSADSNTPKLRADHELPLEDAVQLYAGLDCADKRLGVTKDEPIPSIVKPIPCSCV